MGAIPGSIETDQQPPMTIPLRHFLIAVLCLVTGELIGSIAVLNGLPGLGTLAHVHLILVGWVCITIMGAMTQFVPVWSGVTLHSRRLANLQLILVFVGLIGFVSGLLGNALAWLIPAGGLMLAGFWTFVYNIGRTLVGQSSYDVTERHFLIALGFFLILTVAGLVLAIGFTRPALVDVGVPRRQLVGSHATLAVFGAILTTIYGALYQLGTMFTQTDLHPTDEWLQQIEVIIHPIGVLALAGGRLSAVAILAQIGGILVVGGALCVGVILVRKLLEMQVPRTPMHTRYGLAGIAVGLWVVRTIPAWLQAPLETTHRYGGPGTVHLLGLGFIGFVVFGTLYHIVPFIIWVHRYSDRLGLEDVPMVDDLYDGRLAVLDGTLLTSGTVALVVAAQVDLPEVIAWSGAGLLIGGVIVFTVNMLLVVIRHSPQSVTTIIAGRLDPRKARPANNDLRPDN